MHAIKEPKDETPYCTKIIVGPVTIVMANYG